MADRYWVGGSGNWDASSTANWSDSSGGSSGASAPTSADNVIFDANSNTGTSAFTVTIAAAVSCLNFTASGLDGVMTVESSSTNVALDVYSSMSLPATNLAWLPTSFGITLTFRGTSSNTITTNGVTLNTTNLNLDAVGGTLTLGSALTLNSTRTLLIVNGTFSTSASNYTLTVGTLSSSNSNTRTINLNASTCTFTSSSPFDASTTTGLTFNAGTSTITCSAPSPIFTGGGLTFYNVTFSNAGSGTTAINGENTFNNLTQTSRSSTGLRAVLLGGNQTVSGTLTLGAANTAIRRINVGSSVVGTRRTITLNGTLSTLADVDFRDIGAAGSVATPWTGTRLGDGLNNNNITFNAPKTVYWNLAGTQNWSATGWATTSTGVPAVNNFPLPQDTAVFTEAGAAGTVTVDQPWWIGSIQMADGVSNRTTAMTLATITSTPFIYGNITLFSNLTISGTGNTRFYGQGITQTITSAGVSWTQPLIVEAPSGTFQLADNLTNTGTAFTLSQGTLDLSSGNRTLTCVTFATSNSNTRSISFGTGNITVTGNNATVFSTSQGQATATGFTVTGTPVVNFTYSGSTGTRVINLGNAGSANAISVNVSAGTDNIILATTGGSFKDIDFTGFSGTMGFSNSISIYGNFKLSTGMTVSSGTVTPAFAAISGTQQITTNGKTIDYNLTVNAPGATVQCQDALTLGSTKTLTLINGTLQLKAGVTSTVGNFATSGTNQKYLQSTLAGTQATLSKASGAVDVSYLTIQDIDATGGATWNAYLYNANVDAGNNTNWNFQGNPGIGGRGLLPAFGFGFTL